MLLGKENNMQERNNGSCSAKLKPKLNTKKKKVKYALTVKKSSAKNRILTVIEHTFIKMIKHPLFLLTIFRVIQKSICLPVMKIQEIFLLTISLAPAFVNYVFQSLSTA